MMYKNGYNRKTVMKTIRRYNHGYQSIDDHGVCCYRANDDNRCIVGCFISDDLYSEDMENKAIKQIWNEVGSRMPLDKDVMKYLQEFHDEKLGDVEGEEFFNAIEQELIKLEGVINEK